MAKLLLLSVVLAMIGIPIVAARASNFRRGVRNVLFLTAGFNLFYLLAIRFVYPRLLGF